MDELQRTESAHYACAGSCRGVSERSGVCEADACELSGRPLVECSCIDGRHGRSTEE